MAWADLSSARYAPDVLSAGTAVSAGTGAQVSSGCYDVATGWNGGFA